MKAITILGAIGGLIVLYLLAKKSPQVSTIISSAGDTINTLIKNAIGGA